MKVKKWLDVALIVFLVAFFGWMLITGISDSRKAWDAANEAVARGEIDLPIYYEGR